jgi:hypothetical protein
MEVRLGSGKAAGPEAKVGPSRSCMQEVFMHVQRGNSAGYLCHPVAVGTVEIKSRKHSCPSYGIEINYQINYKHVHVSNTLED